MADDAGPDECPNGTSVCQAHMHGWFATARKGFKVCTTCLADDLTSDELKEEPADNIMARIMAARRKGFIVIYADDFNAAKAAAAISKQAGGFIPVEEDPDAKLLDYRFDLDLKSGA